MPIPERLVPLFNLNDSFRYLRRCIDGRPQGAPAVASRRGSRLGLENCKRSVRWRSAVAEIGRDKLRVHDLRHTYASLSRRAGADLRLLQKAMGHASITVTAHTYADLFDDELDHIAVALDSLGDLLAEVSLAAADGSGRRVSGRQRRILDVAKAGGDSTTGFSPLAMWLASNPE